MARWFGPSFGRRVPVSAVPRRDPWGRLVWRQCRRRAGDCPVDCRRQDPGALAPGSVGTAEPWLPLALFAVLGAAVTWLNQRRRSAEAGHRGAAALASGPRRATGDRRRHGCRRHRRDRCRWPSRGVQPWRRAAVRLHRRGGCRPERQRADAHAIPRGARRLSGTLPRDWHRLDHRGRTPGRRPEEGRHEVSAAPVGRRDDRRRRTAVHRHAARPQCPRPARGTVTGQRGALAVGGRVRR